MQIAARTAAWGGKALPYLRRVEYLESHGTESLSTGIDCGGDFDIVIKFACLDTSTAEHPICSIWLQYFQYWNFFVRNNSTLDVYSHGHHEISGYSTGSVYTARISRQGSAFSLSLDGIEQSISFSEVSVYNDTPLKIFSNGQLNSFSKLRVYSVAVSTPGALMSAYPVLDLDGRPALYDEAGGRFLYNRGTGEFAWGELDALSDAPASNGGV